MNCAWSPDGTLLASSAKDGTLYLWDMETFQLRHHTEVSGESFASYNKHLLTFSPNGRWLASGQEYNICSIWNVLLGTLHKELRGQTDVLNAAAFDPTSTCIATAFDHDTVRIWDVETGESLFVMEQHTGWVRDVSFSLDGSLLSASWDRTVKIWDASTGVMISSLKGHSDDVRAVCFSPCGSYIASASWDNMVRLWRTSDGTCIGTFTEHRVWVSHVAFSPDGKTLSSAADDGTVFMRQMADIIPAEQSVP